MDLLKGLNDKQKEAVQHVDGPCLVIAGAGSGKTKVLTTRIANLINSGIPSYNILAITFTNKAAKEMKERLNKIVPDNNSFVGTFHALGVRIIRENASLLGLDKNFAIIDSDDVLSIIKKIMRATTDSDNIVKYDPENKPGISNLLNIDSIVTGRSVEEIEKEFENKGYGEFKKYVALETSNHIAKIQEKYG